MKDNTRSATLAKRLELTPREQPVVISLQCVSSERVMRVIARLTRTLAYSRATQISELRTRSPRLANSFLVLALLVTR